LDVTREELAYGLLQALRLAAVSLAFAVYVLELDHDRLVRSARLARRSVLAVALATRLVPTLERDAAGMLEALRGRGVRVSGAPGARGRLARARSRGARGLPRPVRIGQVDAPPRTRRPRPALPRRAVLGSRRGRRVRHQEGAALRARGHRRLGLPGSRGPGRPERGRGRGRLRPGERR